MIDYSIYVETRINDINKIFEHILIHPHSKKFIQGGRLISIILKLHCQHLGPKEIKAADSIFHKFEYESIQW